MKSVSGYNVHKQKPFGVLSWSPEPRKFRERFFFSTSVDTTEIIFR